MFTKAQIVNSLTKFYTINKQSFSSNHYNDENNFNIDDISKLISYTDNLHQIEKNKQIFNEIVLNVKNDKFGLAVEGINDILQNNLEIGKIQIDQINNILIAVVAKTVSLKKINKHDKTYFNKKNVTFKKHNENSNIEILINKLIEIIRENKILMNNLTVKLLIQSYNSINVFYPSYNLLVESSLLNIKVDLSTIYSLYERVINDINNYIVANKCKMFIENYVLKNYDEYERNKLREFWSILNKSKKRNQSKLRKNIYTSKKPNTQNKEKDNDKDKNDENINNNISNKIQNPTKIIPNNNNNEKDNINKDKFKEKINNNKITKSNFKGKKSKQIKNEDDKGLKLLNNSLKFGEITSAEDFLNDNINNSTKNSNIDENNMKLIKEPIIKDKKDINNSSNLELNNIIKSNSMYDRRKLSQLKNLKMSNLSKIKSNNDSILNEIKPIDKTAKEENKQSKFLKRKQINKNRKDLKVKGFILEGNAGTFTRLVQYIENILRKNNNDGKN